MQNRGPAAYMAEFIGTFALVFLVTAASSLYVVQPTDLNPEPFIDYGVIGLVHVFALFFLIQTLAVVSGAHFNPAVTLALTVIRQIKASDALIYVLVQLAGGLAGALLTKALLLDEGRAGDYGATLISGRLSEAVLAGMVVELLGAFFLVWAIVGVAVNPSGLKDWSGLVIGGTLGLLVMVLGPLSGGSFNPVRAFGPALVSGNFGAGGGEFVLVYVLAPALGAVIAAILYSYVLMLPGKKGVGGAEPVG